MFEFYRSILSPDNHYWGHAAHNYGLRTCSQHHTPSFSLLSLRHCLLRHFDIIIIILFIIRFIYVYDITPPTIVDDHAEFVCNTPLR